MRREKTIIVEELVNRLNASPFLILVDYKGMSVAHMTELRKRLRGAGAECKVVKNRALKLAAQQTGLPEFKEMLKGQVALITGAKDVAATAKVLKVFQSEFEKPQVRLGVLDRQILEPAKVKAIADLPSMEVLRAQLLGILMTPSTGLVRILGTPASQLARVLKAGGEKKALSGP